MGEKEKRVKKRRKDAKENKGKYSYFVSLFN